MAHGHREEDSDDEYVFEERTPVATVHAWTPELERQEMRLQRDIVGHGTRLEKRITRVIEQAHQRHSGRIGNLEDENAAQRKELADVKADIINIQGKDGRGGILAGLGGKIDTLINSQDETASKHQAAQVEASREGSANRRTFITIAVGLLIAIIGGVIVMRERQTSVERDVESLRRDTKDTKAQIDRIEDAVMRRTLNPMPMPNPAPATPAP